MNILKLFEKKQALLTGHFLLTSGLHSNKYFQCALILQYPAIAGKLARMTAAKILAQLELTNKEIDCVLSPAIGGIVIGQEIARALKCKHIFTERVEGKMVLRRGFSLPENSRVLVVEDVVTTGGTTRELIELARLENALPVAATSIVDRSSSPLELAVPFIPLLKLKIDTYEPGECPLCKQGGLPAVKPGSRK